MNIVANIDDQILQDVIYLYNGLYSPLNGFMNREDYKCVVNNMELSTGEIWTLPITLPVLQKTYKDLQLKSKITLKFQDIYIGYLEIDDCYIVKAINDVEKIFNTKDIKHPGVNNELLKSRYRVSGKVIIENDNILKKSLNPEKTKNIFLERNWKTIVGFQTRNPVHAAHEYLQRLGLQLCDGLFINPSIGWKKEGDFTEEAINKAYGIMIKEFYPQNNVYYEGFRSYFRYAGPREAIFHALLRKNLGCTHFIIGRDHAGIGNYYGQYEAHELAKKLTKKDSLGVNLLLMREPYFCYSCKQIVTDKHCIHTAEKIKKISGTEIRKMLKIGKVPDKIFMRPEISKELVKLKKIFIEEV